jgi:hypothetical protein
MTWFFRIGANVAQAPGVLRPRHPWQASLGGAGWARRRRSYFCAEEAAGAPFVVVAGAAGAVVCAAAGSVDAGGVAGAGAAGAIAIGTGCSLPVEAGLSDASVCESSCPLTVRLCACW